MEWLATSTVRGLRGRTGQGLIALVVALSICGLGAAPATAASQPPLRWAPPTLTNPITVPVPNGFTHISLSTSQDYILTLPPGGKTGALWIDGGHNVVIIGGEITIPSSANQTDNGADDTDTGIYVDGATGTVHIEGVLINGQTDVMFDGIDINAPSATVQIENVRMTGIWGSFSSEHADAVQTWGGVKDLRIDHLSADGDYQGLTIDPDLGAMGTAEIQDVDLTVDPTPAALAGDTTGGGHMVWLTSGGESCTSFPITFSNVYVADNRPGLPSANTVWPEAGGSLPCAGVLSGGQVTWPQLPVTGDVTLGSPPAGPFVPPGVAGPGYTSPGYAEPPSLPEAAAPPTITGAAQQGQTMTVSHAGWINDPTSYADGWETCDATGAACSTISGATGDTYTLPADDVGRTMRVLESASNAEGTAPAVLSEATPVIQSPARPPSGAPPPTVPHNSAIPTVLGAARVGQTLASSTGRWSGSLPIAYASQWQRCVETCRSIAGATGPQYKLSKADLGAELRILVTAGNAAGAVTATSDEVTVLASHEQFRTALARMLSENAAPAVSSLLEHHTFAIRFDAPSSGHLVVLWKVFSGARPLLLAKAHVRLDGGPSRIVIRLTPQGRAWLRRARNRKLLATGTFFPAAAAPVSMIRTLRLREAQLFPRNELAG